MKMNIVCLGFVVLISVIFEIQIHAEILQQQNVYAPGECDGNFTHPSMNTLPPHYYRRIPHAKDVVFPKCPPLKERPVVHIRDAGGIGDNITDNTLVFKSVLEKIASVGGGILIIDDGIYRTNPFNLTSCLTIEFNSEKSVIKALDMKYWPLRIVEGQWRYSDFITGEGVTDVSFIGKGTIDGTGMAWWEGKRLNNLLYRRGNLITFYYSQYLTFFDVQFTMSPCYNVYPINSQHIWAERISVINPANSVNTDGFDPDSCTNVTLIHSYIHTGDDAIAIKTHEDPTINVTVFNVTVAAAHCAMCIGSHAYGGVHHVSVANATWNGTVNGFCFKGSLGTGGSVTDYNASFIQIGTVDKSCINLDDQYAGAIQNSSVVPYLSDVYINHVTCDLAKGAAGTLTALNNATYTGIHLDDVHISNFKATWLCQYVNGTYRDVTPSMDHCDGMKPVKFDINENLLQSL